MGGGGGELDRLRLTRHTLSSDSLDVKTLYLDNLYRFSVTFFIYNFTGVFKLKIIYLKIILVNKRQKLN